MQPSDSIAAHFERLERLLALEADAEQAQLAREIARQDADGGGSLSRLAIRAEEFGLGDRYLISLAPRNESLELPWTRLGVGTPVLLSEEGEVGHPGWRGVVSRVNRQRIEVALPRAPEPARERPTFRLDLASDEIGRRRMVDALRRAVAARGDRLAELREVLLGLEAPLFAPEEHAAPPFFDDTLNGPQRAAVRFAVDARDVAIIHGPPGTGKTTTLVEVIRQSVRRGERVLACAPSNMGVDNLLEKLLAAGENVIRLGHPARVMPGLRAFTLDELAEQHPDTQLARRLRRDAQQLFGRADRFTRARPAPGERRALRAEARQLLDEARRLEAQTVDRLLDRAAVLCATLTSLDDALLGRRSFDLCVIDEGSQSVEPACWLPLPRSNRVVIGGDHRQLPPTVLSVTAARQGLDVSLMERLMAQDAPRLVRRLEIQYRMHETIMGFSSAEFYEGALQADPGVRTHLLCDLPGVAATELTSTPLHFIDTAGAGYDEEQEPDGESRLNPQEAALAVRKVEALLVSGVAPEGIGVIAPYAAQVRWLRDLLPDGVEVNSVDGFQGREKEAIVISLVRANTRGEIGFLAETRRMNVALTRARRKLIVIGDSGTIAVDPFYARLIDYCERASAYHSVWEELEL